MNTFTDKDVVYQAVAITDLAHRCRDCALRARPNCDTVPCTPEERNDDRYVIYLRPLDAAKYRLTK